MYYERGGALETIYERIWSVIIWAFPGNVFGIPANCKDPKNCFLLIHSSWIFWKLKFFILFILGCHIMPNLRVSTLFQHCPTAFCEKRIIRFSQKKLSWLEYLIFASRLRSYTALPEHCWHFLMLSCSSNNPANFPLFLTFKRSWIPPTLQKTYFPDDPDRLSVFQNLL